VPPPQPHCSEVPSDRTHIFTSVDDESGHEGSSNRFHPSREDQALLVRSVPHQLCDCALDAGSSHPREKRPR